MREFTPDLTPEPAGTVVGLRESNLGLHNALGELIDNSLDANATIIEISLKPSEVQICDNGAGCPDMIAMLKLGKRHEHPTTRQGVYGAGLKDAATWFWGRTAIASMHERVLRTIRGSWQDVIDRNSWSVFRASENDGWTSVDLAQAGLPPQGGTVICFSQLPKNKIRVRSDIYSWIGYNFGPAIRNGAQIAVTHKKKRMVVSAFEPPSLENIIETDGEINGKRFSVRAGSVPSGLPNPYHGFTFCHSHRVIDRNSHPANGFSTTRFFAWVELKKGWRLARNKNAITSSDYNALCDALHEICRDVMQDASNQAQDIELTGLAERLSAEVTGMIQLAVKGKRQKKANGKRGTVKPADTGVTHTNFRRWQKGDRGIKRIANKPIRLYFESGLDRIGQVEDNGTAFVITLDADHPAVKYAKGEAGLAMLRLLCASLVASFIGTADDKELVNQFLLTSTSDDGLPNPRERFVEALTNFTMNIGDTEIVAIGAA